jgi:outer membrane protein W
MKSFRFIVTAVALLVVAPSSLFAQSRTSTDVGVFIVNSSFSDTTFVDGTDKVKVEFSEKLAYGVSVNHFWTDQFSTELALQQLSADLNLSTEGVPVTINAGKIDAQSVTALGEWHFRRDARFSPYLGAGVARISGEFKLNDTLLEPGDPSKVDLESETTWSAAAGANIHLTDRLSLGLELKYIPWNPTEKGGIADDSIDVDPLTLSTGLRFRF